MMAQLGTHGEPRVAMHIEPCYLHNDEDTRVQCKCVHQLVWPSMAIPTVHHAHRRLNANNPSAISMRCHIVLHRQKGTKHQQDGWQRWTIHAQNNDTNNTAIHNTSYNHQQASQVTQRYRHKPQWQAMNPLTIPTYMRLILVRAPNSEGTLPVHWLL